MGVQYLGLGSKVIGDMGVWLAAAEWWVRQLLAARCTSCHLCICRTSQIPACPLMAPPASAGTPVQNNMRELFGILNLLNPQQFGDEADFLDVYGDDRVGMTAEQVCCSALCLLWLLWHVTHPGSACPWLMPRRLAPSQLPLDPALSLPHTPAWPGQGAAGRSAAAAAAAHEGGR